MWVCVCVCREGHRGVKAKVIDSDIAVSEIELRSTYCIHCWSYTMGKL